MVRDTSMYEFYWKYSINRGRLKTTQDVCIMVTPSMPASAASVLHDRHEIFARTCVVACWRCMSSGDRARLWNSMPIKEPWFFGGTVLQPPLPHAGARPSELDHFIGVRDLVAALDGPKSVELVWRRPGEGSADDYEFHQRRIRKPVSYGWAYALMEMLVDPVLLEWVPDYIVEQYRRWNPYFTESLDAARSGRPQSNRRFLRRVRRRMEAKHKARQQEEVKTPDVAAVSSESESKGSDSDGSAAHDDAARL